MSSRVISVFAATSITIALLVSSVVTQAQPGPRDSASTFDSGKARALGREQPQGMAFPDVPLQLTGDQDRDFASMMSAHHRAAVDMAKQEISSGRSPKLKAMARRIVLFQQQEIVELDKWSARHNLRLSKGQAQ